MSNFAETVKHFYSQGYPRVYDRGELLNIESLPIFQPRSFHVHGLALPRVENLNQEEFGSVDDYDQWVRQVRFSFHLEGIEIWLYDMQNSSALIAPDSFWEAYNFYKNTIEAADIGSVGSIHFWKKHNSGTPKTLLYGSSKKVDTPKVDAPEAFLV